MVKRCALACLVLFSAFFGFFISSQPVHAQDDGCTALIAEWLDRYTITVEGAAILSGCRIASDGTWFLPVDPDDDRFPNGAILSDAELERVTPQGKLLSGQIQEFFEGIPDYMWDMLNPMLRETKVPRYGYRDPDLMYAGLPQQYNEFFWAVVTVPGFELLWAYADWIAQRRIDAFSLPACLNFAPEVFCYAAVNVLGVTDPIWPWDLADPVTMIEFFRWSIDQGII